MIDAGGEDQQIAGLDPDAHPLVALAADVEIAGALEHVADLFVLVQVLLEEGGDLGPVRIPQRHGRDGDLVPVRVPTFLRQPVDG